MIGWRRAATAATTAALTDPTAWLVALAGFLVRGGVVVVVLPILVLPTTTGLATSFGPTVLSVILGSPDAAVAAAAVGLAGLAAGALVVGGLIGAATDAWLVRRFAEGRVGRGRSGVATIARVFGARVVASLPLAVAVAWATGRFISATYSELVGPTDLATPLVLRVLRAVPETVPIIVAAWLFAEVAGALAIRRIVLSRAGLARALAWAVVSAMRHPAATLGTLVAWVAIGVVVTGPALIASTEAWGRLRTSLLGEADALTIGAAVVVFATLWLGGLVLIGLAGAWASALWTREVQRWRLSVAEEEPSDPGVAPVPTEPVRAG